MKTRVSEGLKTFCAIKMMFNVRSEGLGVKTDLHERVTVPTVTNGWVRETNQMLWK